MGTGSDRSVIPVFKKGKRNELGSYGPVSLTLILRKVMEQIVLETILKPIKNRK